MEQTKATSITIETNINAPIEKVWNYWNEPSHITQWCQASPDWHAPYAENNLVKGGSFKTTMAAKDGSMQFDFGGVYDEVDENRHIAYTMGDGRKVDVKFFEEGNNTKVIERFDAESQNPVEMQRSGWQAILDNFKKHVENN